MSLVKWERRNARDYETSKALLGTLAVAWISRYGPEGQRGHWWIHAIVGGYKSDKWDSLEEAEKYVEGYIEDWLTSIPGVTYNPPGSL